MNCFTKLYKTDELEKLRIIEFKWVYSNNGINGLNGVSGVNGVISS